MLDETGRPIPKVVKTRRAGQDDTRFSRTIVRKTIESMQSYLSEDASSDASLGPGREHRRVQDPVGHVRAAGDVRGQAARGDPARHPGPDQEVHARTT